MSRQQISSEAHKLLPHANPLSVEQMQSLIELALAKRPHTALEVGCGAGAFSIALAERQDVRVVALDNNPYVLERATAAAASTKLIGKIDFLLCSATAYAGDPVDLIVCIGSSQAFGNPRQALQNLHKLLRPNGMLVFAELTWSSKPPQNYLQYLGMSEEDYWMIEASADVLANNNFAVEAQFVASTDAWANYERGVLQGRLEFAKSLPPDESSQLLADAIAWHESFERSGRHCLGFTALVATHNGAEELSL
ncbi:MAG: class I SAM-dependent methyltransferase [Sterolibacterium sp.]